MHFSVRIGVVVHLWVALEELADDFVEFCHDEFVLRADGNEGPVWREPRNGDCSDIAFRSGH